MTSDRKLKASREGSKRRACLTEGPHKSLMPANRPGTISACKKLRGGSKNFGVGVSKRTPPAKTIEECIDTGFRRARSFGEAMTARASIARPRPSMVRCLTARGGVMASLSVGTLGSFFERKVRLQRTMLCDGCQIWAGDLRAKIVSKGGTQRAARHGRLQWTALKVRAHFQWPGPPRRTG